MKKIAIVGFGRFGKTLYRLLKDDFEIVLYNRSPEVFDAVSLNSHTQVVHEIIDIYKKADVIFYAVPIEVFESVIGEHKKYFNNHLLIDVLSVKEHPRNVFLKNSRGKNIRAILTHPLFGPDSSKNGFVGLPLVMDKFKALDEEYFFWKTYFEKKGIQVFEMSATEHDKMVVNSQGLVHFIGRLLEQMKVHSSPIDTLGAKKLFEIMQQACNDSWQLFENLQTYNPYTKKMRIRLGAAYDKLYERLLPKKVKKGTLVFGIQGGRGSFNEEALVSYVKNHGIKKYQVKYLYTTEKVLKKLHEGVIDYGLFAIQNAVGGVVEESIYAMAKYRFAIHEELNIKICHFLMKRKDVSFSDIKTIMAHDQVFKQCQTTLKQKYPNYIQKTGEGDYIDTAKVAYGLAKGILPQNIAVLGPRILADIYNLDIIDDNLQDSAENLTTFFMVKRKGI